jgi:peptide chain release factor subunit 1
MANKYKCNSCNNIDYKIVRDPEKEEKKETIACSSCSKDSELIEELDIFDYFVEIAMNTSTKVELISIDSPEGKQFFETFGGLGAFLRYKI